ncbi:YceD family protein [[Eubacterium] hominis]|uniref:YceD family protein n=1 Tax=[Eubacterium] hominis TaxID=2764325 RepID=UPI003A4D68E0
MRWSKAELLQAKDGVINIEDTISFEPEVFAKMHQIRGLQDVTVSGNIHYDTESDRVFADLDISGVMIVPCSITLEDVEYDFHTKSLEVFSFEKSDDEDVHEVKGDVVELLPVIFQLILMEVPLKVVKKGLKQYPKGDGWEVVKEEDYEKAKSDEIDPRLAKLKEFKLED